MTKNKITKSITLILFLFFLFFPITNYRLLITDVFASIPHTINYQGRLCDSTGKPIDQQGVSVTFRIYDNSAGTPNSQTNTPWAETQSVNIQKGIFNVQIGSKTSGGINLAFDRQYYLGIQVGSDPEMRPLQPLSSSAYAIRAENANNADNATQAQKIEARTSDPSNPQPGQMWLRTD
jgi:hypothetical protein